jgi:hypothetical protein
VNIHYCIMNERRDKKKEASELDASHLDILQIDERIKIQLRSEYNKIEDYKKELRKIITLEGKAVSQSNEIICMTGIMLTICEDPDITQRKNEILKKITEIENKFAEYICTTQDLIKEYREIMGMPLKVSFFRGKSTVPKQIDKKHDILGKFIEIAKNYVTIQTYKQEKDEKIRCDCGNKFEFRRTDCSLVCEFCGKEFETYFIQTTYKDTNRVNMSQKYKYKRKIHFKDTMYQYQGKQNKKIPQIVFDSLEDEFRKHSLLADERDLHKRHKNITKENIYMFLNETGHTSFYEDINYIHRYFTGIACPNISDIENVLMNDFDKIVEVYDSLPNVDRINFLNGQYILYQLLRKHNKKPKDIDFSILKTRERLIEHDAIYEKIAEKLEFNFIPLA